MLYRTETAYSLSLALAELTTTVQHGIVKAASHYSRTGFGVPVAAEVANDGAQENPSR